MIYRRPNSKYYWCRFTAPNGKEIRRSTKTTTKKEAREFEDRLKSSLWRVQHLGDRPRRTWDEAKKSWMKESKEKASYTNIVAALDYADTFLAGKFLDEIDSELLNDIRDAKKETGVENATVNRIMEVVRAALNNAKGERWIDYVPVIKMLKEPEIRVRWLLHTEAERLLDTLPSHTEAAARFSLATGLRESNVTGLEWSQVDIARSMAWVHADQAKAGKAIGVPLNDEALKVIKAQKGKHPTRVFTYKGKPVRKFNTEAWRKALKCAGISNFRWHDLRHTWASWHVQSGTPLHALQVLGGWSDIRMVQKYAHLSSEHLAEFASNSENRGMKQETTLTLSGTPEIGNKKAATNIVDNCLMLHT